MRYEYIKSTSQENMMHFSDNVHELAMFNLKRQSQTQDGELRQNLSSLDKELYPMTHNMNSLSVGHHTVNSTSMQPTNLNGSALINMANRQTRFNYNDYMKTLQDKLSLTAPNTNKLAGQGFQEFILRERQAYLKSVSSASDKESNLNQDNQSNTVQMDQLGSRRIVA